MEKAASGEKGKTMSFVTLSHWTAVKKMDSAFASAKKEFVPMILATGADSVEIVQTGAFKVCVVAHYSNARLASEAQTKIADLQKQSSSEFPMTMNKSHAGQIDDSAWPTI